ncbi:MAG: LacI family transcriptional regulator [Hyphomicrobiales bacterium]|nr:LacI family transcriptional regulator [Hyphomicrobiales bacterium]
MATIYDVAKSAGVSAKTVSRVLNKDAPVADSTRHAVETAMDALGYVPSYAARSMRSNRSGLVGLISGAISEASSSPEQSGLPEIQIFQGVQEALQKTAKTLLIADTGGSVDRIPSLLRTFAEHRVEGVIYVPAFHQKVALADAPGIPEIVIANGFDARGTPSVVPDDYAGQRALVDRLIETGHRCIAYLTLPEDLVATQERTRGYLDALSDAGIPFEPALLRPAEIKGATPDDQRRVLEFALSSVLALQEPPTVICAGNDRLALQFYGVLRTRGIRVPEDISVAGYDDYRLISETLYPPLTTVGLPYRKMGLVAGELLVARLGEQKPPATQPIRVSGDVKWRDSVVSLSNISSRNLQTGRTTK